MSSEPHGGVYSGEISELCGTCSFGPSKLGILKEHRSMFPMSPCEENKVYVLLGNLLLYPFTAEGLGCGLRVRDF